MERESHVPRYLKRSSRLMPPEMRKLNNFGKRCWGEHSCKSMRFSHGSPRNERRNKSSLLYSLTQCHSPLGMTSVKSHPEASSLSPLFLLGNSIQRRSFGSSPSPMEFLVTPG